MNCCNIRHLFIELDDITQIMDVHILHRFTPLTKVFSLHWRPQILPVHCLTLQYCYSFLEFTKVAKEAKLMVLAEGISIRHYIDGWLVRTNPKQQYQENTHWLVYLVEA